MPHITQTIEGLIGKTPLLQLNRIAAGWDGALLAKLEFMNPSGSDKDRVARAILDEAEAAGELTPETVIIEPTSGNVAFSLAMLAAARSYHLILVMPDAVPASRIQLLRAFGAEVVLTPASGGMRGAAEHATRLAEEHPSVFRPRQFSNPANPLAHERTADEIWEACKGNIAAVVAGVGTGGTVTGVGRRLKELSDNSVYVVAVEPAASPVLTGAIPRDHRLYGMGPSFVPENYDSRVVDEVIAISNTICHDTLLRLYRMEGLMSGPTGAAAIAAALRLTQRSEFASQRIVAIIPDTMERYAEMPFWQQYHLLMPTLPDS
ncbi:MAG: pyridoxal-phosphate dependent enzyme [Chloroflexota bacterium]|nr:pyridoxal-phosphate dependent enzyme [Chloroflexota bacterium]